MMYFIKKIFKIKSYCFIGRGGVFYFDGINEYYIDTENYIPNENSRNNYGVAIYLNGIRLKNSQTGLDENKRKTIANDFKAMLTKDKIVSSIV